MPCLDFLKVMKGHLGSLMKKRFNISMMKRESITVTHYSLVIVTENCQIEGNLGYSDSFWLSQYLYYNWNGLYLPSMASLN